MGIKNPYRQIQGARARCAGRCFEALIDASCEYYRMKKQGEIAKTPEPMRPTENLGNGRFVAFYEKQAQPDYKGVIFGGRTVIFEAKHTDSDRIEQSRVTNEQTTVLDRYHQMGAICFVMVSMGIDGYYRVPWQTWQNMKKLYGRKYMTAEGMMPFEVKYHNGVLLFLEGIKDMMSNV